jgi:hypothetical protein
VAAAALVSPCSAPLAISVLQQAMSPLANA